MPETQATNRADHRRHHRLQVALPMLVRGRDIYGASFSDTTSSYNVSREGASFLTRRELEHGQTLELIIPRRSPGLQPSMQADFETTGEVRRIVPHGEGQWEIGVHFTGPRLRTYIPESA